MLPDILLALVGFHIAAVLYHEVRLNERLIAAMLTGKKTLDKALNAATVTTPVIWLSASLVAGVGWLVWLLSLPV